MDKLNWSFKTPKRSQVKTVKIRKHKPPEEGTDCDYCYELELAFHKNKPAYFEIIGKSEESNTFICLQCFAELNSKIQESIQGLTRRVNRGEEPIPK